MTTSLTPYAASKVVNKILEDAGVEKVLPPQMFYNYTSARIRSGKNPLIAVDENGKITEEGLNEWLAKYLVKNGVELEVTTEEAEEVVEVVETVEA